jgi:hypothetical protein
MWPFGKRKCLDELDQKRLDAFGLLAVVSSQCIGAERLPIMHGVREHAKNVSDSGWTLSSGRESPDFSSDAANYKLVPLERMIQDDPSLAAIRDYPVGTEITWLRVAEPWRFIVEGKVVDADGNAVGEIR